MELRGEKPRKPEKESIHMKKATVFNKVLSVLLVVSLVLSLAIPGLAAQTDVSFKQVSNSSVSAKLPGREAVDVAEDEVPYADTEIVRVSIVLEKAGTLEAGYAVETVGTNFFAKMYRSNLRKEQDKITSKIENAIDADLDVVWNLTLAANIISANVAYGQIDEIESVKGVEKVLIETIYETDVVSTDVADPHMATSGAQIGTAPVWATGYTGAGSRIAIIDTGVDVDHISFDAAAFEYSLAYRAGLAGMTPDEYKASLNLLTAAEIDKLASELNAPVTGSEAYINSKIAFGYNYLDGSLDISHMNDNQGEHGSHVSGIAAANAFVPSENGFVSALDNVFVQGVAPDAQLITMKVFGKKGGPRDTDYLGAIEDAIILGADSINLSLGSVNPGRSRSTTEEFQAIMERLADTGVVVSMSAGNSGHWAEETYPGYLYADDVSMHTGGSPGSFTNSLGVASVNNDGKVGMYFSIGDLMAVYNETLEGNSGKYSNLPFSTIAGEHEYVFIDGIGTAEEWAAVGDALVGKIALCSRGDISFFEKAKFAVEAGAIATFIYNNDVGIINMDLSDYPYTEPCASLTMADGAAVKAASTAVTTEDGYVYYTGKMTISSGVGVGQFNSSYYTMSPFSAWGVPQSLIMKPEITAPGGDILSVNGANKASGNNAHDQYELMSGTSMAAPQVTGMAAILAQYIEANGLAERTGLTNRQLAQSLLMSTADPMLANASSYYPVLQQGAGLANVGAALMADTYILMDANATASYADGKVKAELGDDPARTGKYNFSFTINNMDDVEKLYNLSADFFIQAPVSDGYDMYMNTTTALIGALSSFTVDGKAVTAAWDMDGADFNGDGTVNVLDGQALLDYATGLRTELTNAANADFDADGDIDSQDAYLFLAKAESLTTVPANGSVKVDVSIEIPASWKATIDYYYPNGTYLQGYVYADGVSSEEGVLGTSHSIPVLGFYGNWSDPSMYDKGSYMEYYYGLETRAPYMYKIDSNALAANALTILYAGDKTEYAFGGNPMIADATYMPERNAISASSTLNKLTFTAIRNAAASRFFVADAATGDLLLAKELGIVDSAYYYVNGGYWDSYGWALTTELSFAGIPDNTKLEVGLTLAPEYYVAADGTTDWAALGKGATFSMPLVVDNTAPTLEDVSLSLTGNTLTVTASDNQYIAAVALFDIYGQYLYTYTGADLEQNAGDTVEFALNLDEANGPSFLLQVYDYAMNTTTYEIKTQIGEVTDEIESVKISNTSLVMQKGSTDSLSAIVYPVNAMSRDVVWASSDESVVTVDENGVLTAVEVGTAVVTATSVADENFCATCYVEVIDINIDLNGIVWDEEGSIWFSEFNTTTLPEYVKLSGDMLDTDYLVASTMDTEGNLYASSLNTSTGTGSMYRIDPVTFEATKLADCMLQGLHIFYSDLTYAPGMYGTGCLLGTYGPYVITIDPATGEAIEAIDEYDSELVGIASCYGDPWSGNCVYAIQNDGTVVQEIYIDAGLLDESLAGMIIPFSMLTGERAAMDTGISVGDSWYFNSAYYDSESALLFWSAFDIAADDEDVELFAIDADYSGNVYSMGTFAPSVWPVGGLFELNDYDYAYGESAFRSAEDIKVACDAYVAANGVPALEQFKLAKQDLIVKTQSAATPLVPMSAPAVSAKEDLVTIDVTAGAAATNGVSTITFDSAALELLTVNVLGDYTSINAADGSVTIGFVDLDGVAADAVIATLTFKPKNTEDTTVTIVTNELNNDKPGTEEVVEVKYPHTNTEIKDAKDATCTEEGYTGDTYCADCGKLIAKGEVIPAKGHGETEIKDAKEPTCTEEGYTGDTYCTVCGEKVADGEAIPATGHQHTEIKDAKPATTTEEGYTGDTYCTDCGEKIAEGESIPMIDPENPKTSEGTRAFLMATAAVMVAAAAAVVVMLGRKKLF